MIKSSYFFPVLALLIAGCGQASPATFPTSTQTMQATTTSTPEQIVSTTVPPQLTIQVAITANPDQLARWREYENALAMKLLSHLSPEEVLCEWEILGQSLQEVYVWADCLGLPPAGRSEQYAPVASLPAVIYLSQDSSVKNVDIPGSGTRYDSDIRRLFPTDVQKKIFENLISYGALADHVKSRRENPGPPLIVLLSTPQP